jgi:tetratricopeptide (TPR) repeat protein
MHLRKTNAHGLAIALALSLVFSSLNASTDEAKKKIAERRRFDGESISTEKKTADAYYRLGVENLREPSTSDFSIEQLGKAVELDETNAEYHYQLAEAYLANFECAGFFQKLFIVPKVKTHLELAVQCDPSLSLYREALIQYYVAAPGILGGSFVKAHQQADEIGRRDPYLGMLAHAGIFAEEGNGDASLALYKRAMRAQPKSWEAYHRLGLHYLNAQETDEAITMFRKYVDLAPEQASSHNCLGQAYQQKGMYAEAISAFQKALERDPSLAQLVFRIAQLCELKGMKNPALENYQRYLTMIPRGHAVEDARERIRLLMK